MISYLARQLPRALFTFFGCITLVFIVLQFAGDPVATLLPSQASSEDFARLRAELGLDRPVLERYFKMLGGIVSADFGTSFRLQQPAGEVVLQKLGMTLQLALLSFTVSLIFAIPLGVLAAWYRDTWLDWLVSGLAFLVFSIPSFWLGTMVIIVFAVNMKVLPTSGTGTWQHYVLPVLTLAAWPFGQLVMVMRSEMLAVLNEDYIRTARAKGLHDRTVIFGHALRNASIVSITLMGVILGQLLGGAIVTELVFAWPGLGRLAIGAIFDRDWPLVQASVVYTVSIFVLLNLLIDLLYGVLDPRIRAS